MKRILSTTFAIAIGAAISASAMAQTSASEIQRNINQQERIKAGVTSGELTKNETAKLQRGQARVEHKRAVAGRDGHVGAREQVLIQNAENNQSKRIYKQKHDAQTKN